MGCVVSAPPKEGSRRWHKIIKAGCGGTRDYWGEYDCSHNYDWACDDCPIVRAKYAQPQPEPQDVVLLESE